MIETFLTILTAIGSAIAITNGNTPDNLVEGLEKPERVIEKPERVIEKPERVINVVVTEMSGDSTKMEFRGKPTIKDVKNRYRQKEGFHGICIFYIGSKDEYEELSYNHVIEEDTELFVERINYAPIENRETFFVLRDAYINDTMTEEQLAKYGPISYWNMTNITDFTELFGGCETFNADISKWQTSQVTTMEGMFEGAMRFNQPIGEWDVSNVRNMKDMFFGATRFDQNWQVE